MRLTQTSTTPPPREIRRLLKEGGIWVVKTQDEVCGGKGRYTSDEITRTILPLGFERIDKFVLLQKGKPTRTCRWRSQTDSHLESGRSRETRLDQH
jgi:hypothetical protein